VKNFPIKTAFALAISKALAQTLKHAGIHSFFLLHVQFYVAHSRKSSIPTIPDAIIKKRKERSQK